MIEDVGPPCWNLIHGSFIKTRPICLKSRSSRSLPHGLLGGKVEHYRIEEIQQDQGGKIEKNEGGELIFHELFGLRNDAFDLRNRFFSSVFVREIKFMEVHLHSVMGWFIGFKDSRSYQWESCLVDLDFRFVDLGLEGVGGSKSWLLRGGGKWCCFFFLLVSALHFKRTLQIL